MEFKNLKPAAQQKYLQLEEAIFVKKLLNMQSLAALAKSMKINYNVSLSWYSNMLHRHNTAINEPRCPTCGRYIESKVTPEICRDIFHYNIK